MDIQILLPIITTIAGIFIGWVLTEFSYMFRLYREDKRKLRIALYHLLDYYFLLSQLNIDEAIEIVLQKVKENNFIPSSSSEEGKLLLKSFFLDYIKSINTSKYKNLEIKCQNSIDEIAAVNPILAYKLSGNAESYKVFDDIEKYFNQLIKKFSVEPDSVDNIIEFIRNEYKSDFLKEIQESLRSDIKYLSRKINFISMQQSRSTLKKIDNTINNERINRVDLMFKKIGVIINKKNNQFSSKYT